MILEHYKAYVMKKCIYVAFKPSQPSCDKTDRDTKTLIAV